MRAVELRAALEKVPDDADIVISYQCHAETLEVQKADAWGLKTDDPFLRLVALDVRCMCEGGHP